MAAAGHALLITPEVILKLLDTILPNLQYNFAFIAKAESLCLKADYNMLLCLTSFNFFTGQH